MKRPVSVTFIAWFVIVTSLLLLLDAYKSMDSPFVRNLMAQNALSIPAQYAMLVGGSLINVISAVAMLYGSPWGRIGYMGWGAVSHLIGMFFAPYRLPFTPIFVIYGIFVFLLCRPKVSAYFDPKPVADRSVGTATSGFTK